MAWLTQEGYDTLQQELAERSGPRRTEITKRIEAAREEGDLKENGGYHAAKEEQGKNEARIRVLKHMLDNAQVGTPEAHDDEVAHGRVVTVRFVEFDEHETFLLASREEAAHATVEVYSPHRRWGRRCWASVWASRASTPWPTASRSPSRSSP